MLKVIVKMRKGMAVRTTSTQEAGVAGGLTHRARVRPQEEVTLICGGTGSFGRSDAQCAILAGGSTS
jgi:hypothetical protein